MSKDLLQTSVLEFEHEGKEYTVEYDRQTFKELENAGFRAELVPHTPLIQCDLLLRFGLKKNHPNLSERIFKELSENFFKICAMPDFIEFSMGEYNYFMQTTQQNSEEKKFKIKAR